MSSDLGHYVCIEVNKGGTVYRTMPYLVERISFSKENNTTYITIPTRDHIEQPLINPTGAKMEISIEAVHEDYRNWNTVLSEAEQVVTPKFSGADATLKLVPAPDCVNATPTRTYNGRVRSMVVSAQGGGGPITVRISFYVGI